MVSSRGPFSLAQPTNGNSDLVAAFEMRPPPERVGAVYDGGLRGFWELAASSSELAQNHPALRSRSFTTRSWGSPGLLN
jgi:hypothetical protein